MRYRTQYLAGEPSASESATFPAPSAPRRASFSGIRVRSESILLISADRHSAWRRCAGGWVRIVLPASHPAITPHPLPTIASVAVAVGDGSSSRPPAGGWKIRYSAVRGRRGVEFSLGPWRCGPMCSTAGAPPRHPAAPALTLLPDSSLTQAARQQGRRRHSGRGRESCLLGRNGGGGGSGT